MSREGSFYTNTLILSIGRFLPKLTSFITLPILTAHLTKSEYGVYDLINTIIVLLIPIATLQVTTAAFRYLIDCREEKEKQREIISNALFICIPFTTIISVAILLVFKDIEKETRILIVIYFVLEVLYQASGQFTRGLGYNKRYSICAILVSLLSAVGIVVFVYYLNKGINGILFSLIISYIVGNLYLFCRSNIFSMIRISELSKETIKKLLHYSLPVIPNNLSMWVLSASDRLVITSFLGAEANAVYAVANKIPSILGIAQGVLVMAWQENASLAVNDQDAEDYYSRMHEKVLKLNAGLAQIIISFIPFIYKIMIKGDYSESYIHIPILLLGSFFSVMSAFAGGIYAAHKKMKSVGLSSVFAAVINIVLDLIFIRSLGIWAGTLSTVCAYFVLYVYRIIDCQKFQKLHIRWEIFILLVIEIIVMSGICIANNSVMNLINVALGIGLFVYNNWEMINSVKTKIHDKMVRL